MRNEIDIKKIFFSPPFTKLERINLLITLVAVFIVFFFPLQFSPMHPIEAIATAMLPSLTISWGWIVWLRFKFNKTMYLKR